MEYRRNHTMPIRGGAFFKRAVLLVFVVVAMIFWLITVSQGFKIPKEIPTLTVSFLDSTHYLVGKDTTNYDNFASILTEAIGQLKRESSKVNLLLRIPKSKNTGEISDIVQIANAFEGVSLKMSTY